MASTSTSSTSAAAAPHRTRQISIPPATLRLASHPLRSALHLWHLLSLDAPTVATLWTALLARAAHVTLPHVTLPAMFLAVWLLYAADRLLDARHLDTPQADPPHRDSLPLTPYSPAHSSAQDLGLEPRHLFHHAHRRAFRVALLLVAIVLAALIPRLPWGALRLDLLLGALLLAYSLLIHSPRLAGPLRLPKEIAVGLFFAAAVFLPTVAAQPSLRPALAPLAILFTALCSLNCIAIYAWEHPVPSTRQQPHPLTRLGVSVVTPALLLLALATLALLPLSPFPQPLLALALASLLLLLLHHLRHRLDAISLRALADLALATPLLFLLLRA